VNALSETYYGQYAQARLNEAQQTIDQHIVCAYTGVCLACGRPGPCSVLDNAQRTMARYARLPNRRPGASLAQPPPANQRRWTGWFTARRRSADPPSDPPSDEPSEPEQDK
jgi:hypothetical protein